MKKIYRSFDVQDQVPIEKAALTPVLPSEENSFNYSRFHTKAFPCRPSSPFSTKYVRKLRIQKSQNIPLPFDKSVTPNSLEHSHRRIRNPFGYRINRLRPSLSPKDNKPDKFSLKHER